PRDPWRGNTKISLQFSSLSLFLGRFPLYRLRSRSRRDHGPGELLAWDITLVRRQESTGAWERKSTTRAALCAPPIAASSPRASIASAGAVHRTMGAR